MKTFDLLTRLCSWAETSEDVFAALLIGSQARTDHPADEYSDVDVILVVSDPNRFLDSDGWLHEIGDPVTFFDEPTIGGGRERRVLFRPALDVDFLLFGEVQFRQCLREEEFLSLFSRGCQVLVDKRGISAMLPGRPIHTPVSALPEEPEFQNLVGNYLFHIVWAAKKLLRGELWVAVSCINGYMKDLLLMMLEWHAKAMHDVPADTWHSGRFLEQWADSDVVSALNGVFTRYDRQEAVQALMNSALLFCRLAREVAGRLGFHFPEMAAKEVMNWTERNLK